MLMVELKLKVSEAPDVRVVLPNRAENIAVVRQALTGVADAMQLEDGLLSDIKTAVSEACNNVVLHAYDGREGPLEVYVCPTDDELDVVVRDEGQGIQPNPPEPVEVAGAAGAVTGWRMGLRAAGLVDTAGELEVEEQVEPPSGELVVSV